MAVGRFINITNGKYFKKAARQEILNNLRNPEPKVYSSISWSGNSMGNWYESMEVTFLREQLMLRELWFDVGANL